MQEFERKDENKASYMEGVPDETVDRKTASVTNEAYMAACEAKIETMVDQLPPYKQRFIREYRETKERYEKLKAFNNKIEAARVTDFCENRVEMPKHDCPDELLRRQQSIMGEYLHVLEIRAVIEGVDLT